MSFWIVFALFGILGIPFIALALTYGEDWKGKLFGCGVVLVLWLTVSCGCAFGQDVNAEKWNDGYCQCGTHWELRGASEYRSSHTKYYVCPNCYAEIELNY
jgi:hypothetical protein